jgi:Na+-driven multidrug efflux pump
MGIMGLLFYFGAERLTRFFIDDRDVLAWGTGCVRIAALEQAALAVDMVLPGALRGMGDAMSAMYVAIFGTWCVRIPSILLLKYFGAFDVVAGWTVSLLDISIRALLLIVIIRKKNWNKLKTGVYV